MARPDLVRTWVNDVLGIFDPDYAWHELAQVCQTPGDGEKMAAGLIGGTLAERTSRLTAPPFAFSGPVAAGGPRAGTTRSRRSAPAWP
jgi:hypothetical protein